MEMSNITYNGDISKFIYADDDYYDNLLHALKCGYRETIEIYSSKKPDKKSCDSCKYRKESKELKKEKKAKKEKKSKKDESSYGSGIVYKNL